MAHDTASELVLPVSIVTVVDVHRLRREIDTIDEYLKQANVRQPGSQASLPRASHNLEELASQNQLNLLQAEDRQKISQALGHLRDHAPVLHMSFAADPPPAFQKRLITWLRSEIDPKLLLQIGLQPSIAAGCIVRTTNKYFDFSLRKHFEEHRKDLVTALAEMKA